MANVSKNPLNRFSKPMILNAIVNSLWQLKKQDCKQNESKKEKRIFSQYMFYLFRYEEIIKYLRMCRAKLTDAFIDTVISFFIFLLWRKKLKINLIF